MKQKIKTLEEAVGLIKDGDLLSIGGFCFHRIPMELSREIVRQGKKDLRIASLQTLISTDLLIGAKAVKSVRFAMNQFELFGFVSNFTRAAESNEIEVIEDT